MGGVMRKEDIYLDLSKLSKEERKEIYSILETSGDKIYISVKVLEKGMLNYERSFFFLIFCEKDKEWRIANKDFLKYEKRNQISTQQFKELFQYKHQFKQGDKVLVRDDEDDEWVERFYATEYNGNHYVESKYSNGLSRYVFIKPYEEQIKIGDWVKNTYGTIFKYNESIQGEFKKITNPQLITLLENEFTNQYHT